MTWSSTATRGRTGPRRPLREPGGFGSLAFSIPLGFRTGRPFSPLSRAISSRWAATVCSRAATLPSHSMTRAFSSVGESASRSPGGAILPGDQRSTGEESEKRAATSFAAGTLPLPTLCGLRRAKIFRPLARAVHHGQHVHLIAHLIGHDVGSSRQHQLAGAGDAAHSPDHGIVGKESVRPLGNVVHKPERSGEVVLRDVIRDRLKTFEGGARPDNPHQLGQYLARSRSKSAGVAKRPAAASSRPARTLSTNRSCHSSEWPCSSASATTSAGERLDRAATASTRACS